MYRLENDTPHESFWKNDTNGYKSKIESINIKFKGHGHNKHNKHNINLYSVFFSSIEHFHAQTPNFFFSTATVFQGTSKLFLAL
jgi:hypothetical protein